MNERTKIILNWALAVIISGTVFLLILFPEAFGAFTVTVQKVGYILADPAMILIEYATRNSINQFGGDMSAEGFNSALLISLLGAAIVFIIAPTLMIVGYKKSRLDDGILRPITWHIGTGVVMVAIVFGIYSSINWSSNKENLVKSTKLQHSLDDLQFELIDLYFDASATAILPREKGGGNGQFTNFLTDDGSTRDIQLSDLNRYNPNGTFEFVISEEITDSTITITGISDYNGDNPDFQNADGRTGKIQLTLTMNPYEDNRLNIKRENERLYANRES